MPSAHAGRPLREGRALLALKMVSVVARIARTIKLQPKFTKRRNILAIRTRNLIFWSQVTVR